MAQVKTRTGWWKFNNGKWMKRAGFESQAQAQARFNANPSLATSTVPPGSIKDGAIDICNENEIRGWGMNPGDDLPPNVDIWINGVVVESVFANQARPDVSQYYGVPSGVSAFGFSYIVPAIYKLPGATVRATLKGRTDNFENSPRLMDSVGSTTVPAQTTTVPVTTSTTNNGSTTVPVSTTSTSTTTQPQTTLNQNALDTAVGPKPYYAGQIDQAVYSDENYLSLEVVEVNSEGLVRLRNKAPNRNPDNGRTGMYHVDTNLYISISDFESRWFEPYQELIVEYFWADLSVPGYAWQAEHQPYNFFKADAIISFK